jgi:hypothetical protein
VRNFAGVLLWVAGGWTLLATGCATPESKQTDVARKTFQDWAKAAAAGDADKTLAMFTDAKKSEWLFERLEEGDPLASRWRGELTGPVRTDLDLWWGIAHKTRNGRDPLRATVLAHPTFLQLWREYFMQSAAAIKMQLSKLEVTSVYGDDSGITVAVKCGAGAPTELYGLVYERDGWKIDTYRQPLSAPK